METNQHRAYWLAVMQKIGRPVLDALSKQKLKSTMPLHFHAERAEYAPLEALGRLACGMAPWLELNGLTGPEEKQRAYYTALMLESIEAATSPSSSDYMVFDSTKARQPLVDTAFLCHAFLRAPNSLVKNMDTKVKKNVIAALKTSRAIQPWNNNWLLFSAMVESALDMLNEDCNINRVDESIRTILSWYKGDGMYGDGPAFHFDYYNSFVIHPMLLDIINHFSDKYADIKEMVLLRAQRHASILERMISPDGAYPLVGRSLTYRYGAFQLLSQAALQHFLDKELPPAQVRCALNAVINRTMEAENTFDAEGWLRPGVYGFQPELAESYITIGSLYLCASVFLPLGLAPNDEFWAQPDMNWTSRKAFFGEKLPVDKALVD